MLGAVSRTASRLQFPLADPWLQCAAKAAGFKCPPSSLVPCAWIKRGVVRDLSFARLLWSGEELYLQLDSHMRFVPGSGRVGSHLAHTPVP